VFGEFALPDLLPHRFSAAPGRVEGEQGEDGGGAVGVDGDGAGWALNGNGTEDAE
jgi:hypothetical protein